MKRGPLLLRLGSGDDDDDDDDDAAAAAAAAAWLLTMQMTNMQWCIIAPHNGS